MRLTDDHECHYTLNGVSKANLHYLVLYKKGTLAMFLQFHSLEAAEDRTLLSLHQPRVYTRIYSHPEIYQREPTNGTILSNVYMCRL